jgi:hypothetical protein
MNASTEKIRELATHIVGAELVHYGEAERSQAFAKVFERLRDVLAPMVGELGFSAVVKRAVWLTARNGHGKGFPAETGFAIDELKVLLEREGLAHTARWAVNIVEQSISLLNSFLGESLTLKMVERAFPEAFKRAGDGSKHTTEGSDL